MRVSETSITPRGKRRKQNRLGLSNQIPNTSIVSSESFYQSERLLQFGTYGIIYAAWKDNTQNS